MSISFKAVLFLMLVSLISLQMYVNKAGGGGRLSHYIVKHEAEMSHVRLIKRFFQAQNKHKAPSYFSVFFAKRYAIDNIVTASQTSKTSSGIVQRIASLQHRYPLYRSKVKMIIADGNDVMVRYALLTRAGRSIMQAISVFSMRNGKIRRVVEMNKSL